MNRPPLADLHLFASVAALGSFRAAAERAELSPSAVSHRIKALETRLGLRLIHRTTRSMSLTPAGKELLTSVGPALRDIAEALVALDEHRERPRGRLRIDAPRLAARFALLPALLRYRAREPEVELEIRTHDGLIDIVADGFDAGVRFREDVPPDMVAVPLGGPQRFVVAAAPGYLACHGVPTHPDDLRRHRCIRLVFPSGRRYPWEFEREGVRVVVDVPGTMTLDDTSLALDAACAGEGLAFVYEQDAASAVADQTLVTVLDDWRPVEQGLMLYYPSRRQLRPALRGFVDLLLEEAASRRGQLE